MNICKLLRLEYDYIKIIIDKIIINTPKTGKNKIYEKKYLRLK